MFRYVIYSTEFFAHNLFCQSRKKYKAKQRLEIYKVRKELEADRIMVNSLNIPWKPELEFVLTLSY